DEARTGDGGVADAAAAEHRDGVIALYAARVEGGAEARHHAAAEEAGGLGGRGRGDLRRLPGRDERLVGEGAVAERRRERGPVGERRGLRRVVRGEAVPGLPSAARPALAAHGAPVEDDEVARRDRGDVGSDRVDGAGRLVPEEVGEVVADAAVAVVEV